MLAKGWEFFENWVVYKLNKEVPCINRQENTKGK